MDADPRYVIYLTGSVVTRILYVLPIRHIALSVEGYIALGGSKNAAAWGLFCLKQLQAKKAYVSPGGSLRKASYTGSKKNISKPHVQSRRR